MKCISWNVNGIRAILNKGFVDILHTLDADVFCLQETKEQPEQIEVNTDLYPYQYVYSAQRKGYSGTMIFSKKEPRSVRYGLGIDQHDTEGRVITLEFDTYYLITVYTPNSGDGLKRLSYRMEWDQTFASYIRSLDKPVLVCGDLNESPSRRKSRKPVIICGDFNVARTELDIKNPKSNVHNAGFTIEERESFERNLMDEGFIDTFRYLHPDEVKYSWWSYRFKARERNAGWRIDYFLTSPDLKDKIKNADILTDIYGSDHCPIELDIDI